MPESTNTEDILNFLNSDDGSEVESPFPDPLAKSAQRQSEAGAQRYEEFSRKDPSYSATFKAENQIEGVPLDIESGAGWWDRVRGSFRSSPEQTVKFWQDLYGSKNVRPAVFRGKATGGLIVRDATTNKDILVDEDTLSSKDLADMAGVLPELGAAIASGIVAKRALPLKGEGSVRGLARTARDIVSSTIGSQTVGALKDISTRYIDEMPIEFGKVIEEHAKAIPRDLFWSTLLAGAGKGLSKVLTPFPERPPVAREGMEAAEYLKGRFGQEIPYSTAEKTGVPAFGRVEQEMKRLPGGGGAYTDVREQQQSSLQSIMDRLRGLPPKATRAQRAAMPSEEDIGREAVLEMQQHNTPYDVAVQNARRKLVNRSQQNVEEMVSQATLPQRQLYADTVGERVRNRAIMERDAFTSESQALYEKAKSLPGGQDRILIAKNLPKKAAEYLEKELPSKESIVEVPTGVLDEYGNMVTKEVTERTPMKEMIPGNVIGKLKELASTRNTKWSLQDLIAMRNEVSNDIAVGESIAGVQTHHLKKIREMLTGAIKDSTDAIPDKQLRNAWQKANDYYSGNVGKFHTKLVSSMLKQPNEPGYVGAEGLLDRILSNTDNILEARKFLGGDSHEYGLLKRSIADRIMNRSLIPGTKTLDGGAFVKQLANFQSENPRAYNEVFGVWGDRIQIQAENIRLGQLPKLDADTIEREIATGYKNPRLREWITAEKERDLAYQNSVRKWIGSKKVPGDLKPSEFVSRFLSQASPSEAAETMKLLGSNPGLQTRIRQKAVENLLNAAERAPTESDRVALRLDPNRIINSEKLIKLLGDPEKQRVYENILGPQGMKDLESLAKALRPIEQKQAAFAGAGGIGGGMAVSGALRGGIIGFLDKTVRHKIISTLITMRPTRAWLENTKFTGNAKDNLMLAAVTSQPFWDGLVDDYGEEGAARIMRQIGHNIGIGASPSAPTRTNAIREFLHAP